MKIEEVFEKICGSGFVGKIFESKPSYQKGLIGEEIVKKYLEFCVLCDRRPDDTAKSGASALDFLVEDIYKETEEYKKFSVTWFVEVKVKSPKNYAYGRLYRNSKRRKNFFSKKY